ncbi:hypothetical protein [Chthonobacter rhizosphaerae]|uniref:hypothetical protein n=1 Tax=Chthonobacter rhizosphaerae TaxID=2735553 RepID=UPI0015EE9035|nr:hypothetical protein [Chthonobacter rhizosphaerae]
MTCTVFDELHGPLSGHTLSGGGSPDGAPEDVAVSTGASIVIAVAAAIALTLTIIIATLSAAHADTRAAAPTTDRAAVSATVQPHAAAAR